MSKKKWYTNGQIQVLSEVCPEGFNPGRLPVSDETRKKHSENNAWKKMSEEQKQKRAEKISSTIQSRTDVEKQEYSKKMSEARKGKGLGIEPWNKNKKGLQIAWNKGLVMSDEFKQKVKNGLTKLTPEQKIKKSENLSKSLKNRAPWNTGLTKETNKTMKTISEKNTGLWTEEYKQNYLKKSYDTKKKNGTFNTSGAEEKYYKSLVDIFGAEDVVRQYRDNRYPFNCDFYIRTLDLFIELNITWTHGGKLFENTKEDLLKLEQWQDKAKTSDFYLAAIETWTKRDVEKFRVAKENNLRYKVFYKEADLEDFSWLEELR